MLLRSLVTMKMMISRVRWANQFCIETTYIPNNKSKLNYRLLASKHSSILEHSLRSIAYYW